MTATTAPAAAPARITIADALPLPRTIVRPIVIMVGIAALTALAAQISFHLPWTPVPVTGQTFAVLLTGAAVGWRLGAAGQLLYLVAGIVGLPVYTGATHGWKVASGATSGYLIGFIVAAGLVGLLAERRQDRSLLTSLPAMLAGTAIIYALGAAWLSHSQHYGIQEAIEKGVAPFLIGDTIKLIAAGALLPATWRLLEKDK